MMVRTKVKDFTAWKSIFDQHSEARRQNGSKGGFFFQNADNPNETIFLLEWDNLDNARRFAGDHTVQNVLAQAGLTDRPEVYFLETASKPRH